MTCHGLVRFLVPCLVLLVAPGSLLGQLRKAGTEFRANSYTPGSQRYPAVALEQDGGFVLTWNSYGQDGDNRGVFARRFSANGVGLATEFQVNSFTSNIQSYPSVAVDDDGDFVVVWSSNSQDGSGYGVFGKRFNSSGVPQGTEFQINTYTPGSQSGISPPTGNGGPSVAIDGAGDFVVVWHSFGQDRDGNGVFARMFSAAGTPLQTEFQVNVFTPDSQEYPAIDLDDDGDFVVTWQTRDEYNTGFGIFARRFASNGTLQGVEFQVPSSTVLGAPVYPTVGLDDDGDFVVAWQSYAQDGDYMGVFARRFSSLGVPLNPQFQVNSFTSGAQRFPTVVLDGSGDFVVAWTSYAQDGFSGGVFAQRFDSTGARVAAEFMVNTYTSGNQSGTYAVYGNSAPAVGIDSAGDFVVAWHSNQQDGSSGGIFAQRYAQIAILDIDASGAIGALTDGLLVLRFMFGFTGATLTNGAVDLTNCTRCQADDIESYLELLI